MTWFQEDKSYYIEINDSCKLFITAEQDYWAESGIETLLLLDSNEARANFEEPLQLLESCTYEYELNNNQYYIEKNSIFIPFTRKLYIGRISPKIYVGRLTFFVKGPNSFSKEVAVEVRSVKTNYRSEYRHMLEDITTYCTELLMSYESPVTQRFSIDHNLNSQTLYQRFSFVKSIFASEEFKNAMYRIISMPVTAWKQNHQEQDIWKASKITSTQLKQIVSKNNRTSLPKTHPLYSRMNTVPQTISVPSRKDSVDTSENRFIKHALTDFLTFCSFLRMHIENNNETHKSIYCEVCTIEEFFFEYLNNSFFIQISNIDTIPFHSPILQKKEGYREIFRSWLMFDLAAKLCWDAFEETQYDIGKRDVATLYEYWVFFKLLEIVKDIFKLESKDLKNLIVPTNNGMGLTLKQGKHTVVSGKIRFNNRYCKMHFSYNKTFKESTYPHQGSWTQSMRPDYTISIWPAVFTETDAEKQELIIHIHFDAKYKIDALSFFIEPKEKKDQTSENESSNKLNIEKLEEKEGTYKRADLLKMHAYKDAIRRTAGAYVIYPGSEPYRKEGFHEIVPGLGAFPLSPSFPEKSDSGSLELKNFIFKVLENFTNRISQWESLSYHTYDIHRKGSYGNILFESLPELKEKERAKPILEATVLVGYYNENQYEWIKENNLYNIRVHDTTGFLKYSSMEMEAKYLLLHNDENFSTNLWEIIETPKLFSKETLLAKKYPRVPTTPFYLVYKIKRTESFKNTKWDVKKIKDKAKINFKRPVAISFYDFLESKI